MNDIVATNLTPSQNNVKFVMRLPRNIKNQLADIAQKSRRSLNSEIVSRLERSFNAREIFQPCRSDRFEQDLLCRKFTQMMDDMTSEQLSAIYLLLAKSEAETS